MSDLTMVSDLSFISASAMAVGYVAWNVLKKAKVKIKFDEADASLGCPDKDCKTGIHQMYAEIKADIRSMRTENQEGFKRTHERIDDLFRRDK